MIPTGTRCASRRDGWGDLNLTDHRRSELDGPWVSYAAALWAAVFAVFHIIWAAGWYPLLDAEQTRIAFATPWKWWFDVVVAGMCVIAVPVALTPVTTWGRRLPQRPVYVVMWIGTALLDLRLIAATIQTIYLVAAGRFHIGIIGIWDWWFVIGSILFTLSAWRWSRTRANASVV